MKKQNRLEFYYTDLEWTIAETNAKKTGSKSLPHYLTKKIVELKQIHAECEECVNKSKIKSKRRKYYPANTSWEVLETLSKQIGISPSILVSRLIINPLLNNDQ